MIETYMQSWLFYIVVMLTLTFIALAATAVRFFNKPLKAQAQALQHSNHASESNEGKAI
jgi:uncharacterized protein (DUF58 family)